MPRVPLRISSAAMTCLAAPRRFIAAPPNKGSSPPRTNIPPKNQGKVGMNGIRPSAPTASAARPIARNKAEKTMNLPPMMMPAVARTMPSGSASVGERNGAGQAASLKPGMQPAEASRENRA